MIIDAFMWSYEREAVEVRLKALEGVVDAHVAVQATNTFRGESREVVLIDHPKVTNVVVTIPDGLDPWESEKWLRDQVLWSAIGYYGLEPLYMICDGDEIPNPEAIKNTPTPCRLMTDYRNFYADWRAKDHVLEHQPTLGSYHDYGDVGGAGDARWHANWPRSESVGWHLSSLGDTSEIKLRTFAHTEYDNPKTRYGVKRAKRNKRDFLDRFDLEYTADVPLGTPAHLLGGKI